MFIYGISYGHNFKRLCVQRGMATHALTVIKNLLNSDVCARACVCMRACMRVHIVHCNSFCVLSCALMQISR